MTYSISERRDRLNKILSALVRFYREREIQLVNLCRVKGITDSEIARHIGVTRGSIEMTYPKTYEKEPDLNE